MQPQRLLNLLLHHHLPLPLIKQLHAQLAASSSLSGDPFLALHLLRSYAAFRDTSSARKLFDTIPHRNIYLWNSVIRAHAAAHDLPGALLLLSSMRRSPTSPDARTLACVLRALAEDRRAPGVQLLHGIMLLSGLDADPVACSALVTAYSKVGHVQAAFMVFDRVQDPDLALRNAMISACGCDGWRRRGLAVFRELLRCGKDPDGYSLVGVLSCLWDSEMLVVGKSLHGFCMRFGYDGNVYVRSALVSMYSRCNCLESAYLVFRSLQRPDLPTWSAMLCGFSRAGESWRALELVREMTFSGQKPDRIALASALPACVARLAFGSAREIHGYTMRAGLGDDVPISCALMDVYIKLGFRQLGLQMFGMIKPRTTTAYNIMISGLGSHGLVGEAFAFFDEMLAGGHRADAATFTSLLAACCHSGLAEEAGMVFGRMQEEFGIGVTLEHCVYMVRVFGIAGRLEEAYEFIRAMPMQADRGVWGALLFGCNVHGDEELGRMAARWLFQLAPGRSGAYKVMVSNMYASQGRWDDADGLRNEMREDGVKKVLGLSWVATDYPRYGVA